MGQSTSGRSAPLTSGHPTFPRKAASAKAAAQAIMRGSSPAPHLRPAPLVPPLTLDNLPVCAFSLGPEDHMTLDLIEACVRPGASSPDPSTVIADLPRGIDQGQLAASGMLARMGAIVRQRHISQPLRPSAAVTAVRMWCR